MRLALIIKLALSIMTSSPVMFFSMNVAFHDRSSLPRALADGTG
jgi:hypothetical protein